MPKVNYYRVKSNLDFIKHIANVAGEEATNELIDQFADQLGTPERIFKFVQQKVKYVKDPLTMDTIRRPHVLLERIQKNGQTSGDCDCQTSVLGAMLLNRGYPVRFVAAHIIKPKDKKNDLKHINHVYLEFRDIYGKSRDKWLPLEPTAKIPFEVGQQSPTVLPLYRVYVSVRGEKIEDDIN